MVYEQDNIFVNLNLIFICELNNNAFFMEKFMIKSLYKRKDYNVK